MEQIIANLLVSDNDVVQKATAELQEAFKNPETIPALCNLVVSSSQTHIRQYAAVLLRKRLGKLRNWQQVTNEQQELIKHGMLTALFQEPEKPVRNSIAQFIGVLIKHEYSKQDQWMSKVLKLIFDHCSSADPKESELGSSIFATLTDVAPDQFVPHITTICEMFSAAMVATEASGNMVTPVVYNIIVGMAHLVPFILGHNNVEHTYQKAIPYLVKALQGFAIADADKFVKGFDILENLADYTPKLLTSNLKILIDFCLEAANNIQLDTSVRNKCVAYIGWLVRLKKKAILKQQLILPIIQVVFKLMATEPEDEEEEEEYFVGGDNSSPMTTATQTMDLLALHVPPEKLIPPLLQLLEPALKGSEHLPRKAAYLCMAVIAEGCSEAICAKYLPALLDIVKVGITDTNTSVRNAAFFALGQFSEHLQPDIIKYAPDILPILFEYLQKLCIELKNGATEPKHIDRMFYALETYCENLEDALVPHLPVLMERLFQSLDPNNSVHLRELALSAVSAAANATKENMLPYFPQLIEGLKTYLVKTDNEDICALRPQAIDTLAALARTIGKQNFLPLASDTMSFGLTLMDDADDPELRRALYNLIASLAEVINQDMAGVLPKIVERMLETVQSTEEVIPQFKEDGVIDVPNDVNDENLDREIDIEISDGEDDDLENIAGYSVENSYLDEKEEAILALKEMAEHTGVVFIPYIQSCYEAIYKVIDHPQEDIRKVSIDALSTFIIALYKQNDQQGVANAVTILLPKLGEIIRTDEECTVVMAALEALLELLKELKQAAITSQDMKDLIFGCISDVMHATVACQFNEPLGGDNDEEESEYDEAIIEAAGNVLPIFGQALNPDEFSQYFSKLCPTLVQKIEKSRNKEEFDSQRCFAYGTLSECFAPLQHHCNNYFTSLLPILSAGVADHSENVRQNAVFGLGEIVLYADEKTYEHFPQILAALSNAVAKEEHPGTLDNICGAIARLIIKNYKLVPLEQVLPVFFKHLPLKDDYNENGAVFKCFKVLYGEGLEILLQYIQQIVAVGLHVLYEKQFKDQETYEDIVHLLKDIRDKFPEQFNNLVSTSADLANFVQTL